MAASAGAEGILLRLFLLLLLFNAHTVLAAGMGEDDARHLLIRTGFLPAPAEVARISALDRQQAIDALLGAVREDAQIPAPSEIAAYQPPPRGPRTAEEKRERNRRIAEQMRALRGWWISEMIETDSPLLERMTLFWHNHFATSAQKVRDASLMYRQNQLLRREALGNFARMLHAVAKDPAMLIYLDARASRKEQPNENFAREVMELFTLGEGHYGERDVKEAARAFTGWGLDKETGSFVFRRRAHDDGEKTVLGQTGRLDGDAVLDILLANPATARFVVTKLWREFVSPRPDEKEIARIAAKFFDSGYDIKVAMRELLGAPAFWAAGNRAALIKSPVEFVVGTVRVFGFAVDDGQREAALAGKMGQSLFAPPNVKGWPGGEAWIDSSTLLARAEFVNRIAGAKAAPAADSNTPRSERLRRARFNGEQWLRECARLGVNPQKLLLGVAGPSAAADADSVRGWLLDSHYQLK